MMTHVMLHRVAWLALLVALAGWRTLPAGADPPLSHPSAAEPSVSQPSASSSGLGEAPEACGFPAGTALEYAGRSTTAELDVQEVVGDPMSDDPADIYITSEAFDQGDLHGRLVCANFVNDPGFVEVTVHPEDGGRFVEPTPYPSVPTPAGKITRDDAVEIAIAHVTEPGEWEVVHVEAGPIGRILPHVLEDDHYAWAAELLPDVWVWRVHLVLGDRGIDVIVDYLDGAVLGTAGYIVN